MLVLESSALSLLPHSPQRGGRGELREEVRLLTAAETPGRLRAETRTVASCGRVSNKSLSAGIMRRYSNPEIEDRLDWIAAIDLEGPTRR